MKYDIIVVGGGHAGCEAAASSAKQGLKTALITSNKSNIADMPCNPSIGGTAKGIVVREIDAQVKFLKFHFWLIYNNISKHNALSVTISN